MQDLEVYQRAVMEYSRLAPRTVITTLAVVPAQTTYTLPETCIGVLSLAWGDEGTLMEVLDNTTETQMWAANGLEVVLSPAPTEVASVRLVYQGVHEYDELNAALPTVPKRHAPHIDDLEQALLLELQADQISNGPVIYSVGQTEVSRAEALKDLRDRAALLRRRVAQALDEPLALWR